MNLLIIRMKHNKRELLRSFSVTALCFICTMLAIKLCDFETFEIFLKAAIHCLVTSGFMSLIVFTIYCLLCYFSKKIADWTSSILFGIIVFGEIGLTIYANESGQLMGKELFIRPLAETMQTVMAAMSLFSVITITLAVIGGFALLTFFARRKLQARWTTIFVSTLAFLSIPSIFFIDNVLDNTDNLGARNRETSKMWFMAFSNFSGDSESIGTDVTYNEQRIDEFLAENPNYSVPDKHYPLERIDNTTDVLGSYFRESDKKPNIVLIVVESLGNEMMGNGLSPFIDSLASHGLYWKNCMSTTTRSYGAVPAITSSVIGPKGFQFGVMPEHNSLIKILKANGYRANAFYGGDFSFDCISEYLIAQDIDYMSDFYNECKANKNLGSWWGFFDHVMFNRSIEEISKMESPMFNLLITITNHEALNIKDEQRQREFTIKTDAVIANMDTENADIYSKNKNRFCSMLYTDDCIRNFINKYKQLPNFDNTIFIITGDHSSGLILDNRLSYFRVPLIIWSPMLEKTGTFSSLVTHNDIAPSINALLREKYKLNTPKLIHWISDGLDTSNNTNFNKKMLHVNYNREMREIIYDNYIYWTKDKLEDEGVEDITDLSNLKITCDDSLKSSLHRKLELYKYICRYTYYNNKVTNHPIIKSHNYHILNKLHEKSKIICTTPDKKPSEVGTQTFKLFDDIAVDEKAKKIKVTLNAEVFINDSLLQDDFMDLVFECVDRKTNAKINYIDKVSKFLKTEIIRKDRWYDLSVSKEFAVKDGSDIVISVYISSVRYDDQWVGGSVLTVGDRHLIVEI